MAADWALVAADHVTPHRLVLLAIHAAGVLGLWGAANLAWPGLGRVARGCIAAAAILAASLPGMRTWEDPPRLERGDQASTRLWGISLPTPDVVIRRVVPVPDAGQSGRLRLRVNLAAEYRGAAYIVATVNGTGIGPLLKEGESEGRSTVDGCREAFFDGVILGGTRTATVDLHQPVPDPDLRVAVFGTSRGASAKDGAAWTGTALGLTRGVSHPSDGRVRPGAPIVWLEAG